MNFKKIFVILSALVMVIGISTNTVKAIDFQNSNMVISNANVKPLWNNTSSIFVDLYFSGRIPNSVYQIPNLDNIDLKNISSNEDIIILAKKFIDDYNNSKYKNAKKVFDLADRVNEIPVEEHEISNAKTTFYNINAKVARILKTKNISIKQVNLIKELEGDAFGLIFATFGISPKLATALGIITVFIN